MHMNRNDLVRKICSLVENSSILTLPQMESDACKTEEYKKGLYFLYDVNNVCIYVGKVGSGQTSLYHRMIWSCWWFTQTSRLSMVSFDKIRKMV